MPTLEHPTRAIHVKQPTPLRRVGISVVLWLLLFGATLWNEQAYHLLDMCWQKAVATLGVEQHVPSLLQPGNVVSQVMRRPHSIPAVLLYSVLYVGICLLLLFSLLLAPLQRRLVVLFYGLAGIASVLLLMGSRVGASPSLAILSSELVHFVVSPVPVIMLIPLLRWYAPQATLQAQPEPS